MSITELLEKLPNIAAVTLQAYAKNQQILFPLRGTSDSLQMLFYWWSEAIKELEVAMGQPTDIVQEQAPRVMPVPPTLLGTIEQLNYVTQQLRQLSEEAQIYLEESVLPGRVRYKVERGYDKVMEALFNTSTAISHYGTVTGSK